MPSSTPTGQPPAVWTSSVSCCFFFYCYGDHRDLHSFPTRRSSDLQARRARQALEQLDLRHVRREQGRVAGPEDRKSTRLNSRHMSISYAVFCLKKKKLTAERVAGGTGEDHAGVEAVLLRCVVFRAS